MQDQIVWVDMPVIDLDRAAIFYGAMLAGTIEKQSFEQFHFAVLPHADTNVSGCLIASSHEDIITRGPLIYFNVNGRMDEALTAVEAYGGKVLENKHPIGPHGFRAIILDSEGNRIALHSSVA